ncbi:MAG: T9SS type A sorting domain-containing protein [Flavobacteriales bacterium]|nr:T9SS type A sorting domain-containing protein [Flavobacteriales bacterium]
MKTFLLTLCTIAYLQSYSQMSVIGIPDSVANVSHPTSNGAYTITNSNPLNHNGTAFTNPPITVNCVNNCKSDYLYFYDLDLNIPPNFIITGVEVIHGRGACNQGSWNIDSIHLAYNGAIIGTAKRDSASVSEKDTLGSSSDVWNAMLTPGIVNSNSFGLFINSTGTGICTFMQSDIRVKVYYNYPLDSKNNPVQSNSPIIWYSKGSVHIENSKNKEKAHFRLYDITGKLLMDKALVPTENETIFLKSLFTEGIYIVSVVSNTFVHSQKIIIE